MSNGNQRDLAHGPRRTGPPPCRHAVPCRFGVALTPYQTEIVERYLTAGVVASVSGRGSGKTFVLAYLAALELDAGGTVMYRTSLGYRGTANFVRDLASLLGSPRVDAARRDGRLRLPAGPAGADADAHRGVTVGADLRDEAWGGWFSPVRSARVATVGSLPDDTIYSHAFVSPGPLVNAPANTPRRVRNDPPDTSDELAADPCIRVGPAGRIEAL